MRRVVVLVAVLAVAGAIGLTRPTSAAACTGCAETLTDLVKGADRIVLVQVVTGPIESYVFRVEQVFKGPAMTQLMFPVAGSLEVFPVHSRWILVLAPGHGLDFGNAFAVETDGRVLPGGPFDVPTTLAGWYAAFGLPATDTATPAPGQGTPAWFLLSLVAAGSLGWLASMRRPVLAGPQRGDQGTGTCRS